MIKYITLETIRIDLKLSANATDRKTYTCTGSRCTFLREPGLKSLPFRQGDSGLVIVTAEADAAILVGNENKAKRHFDFVIASARLTLCLCEKWKGDCKMDKGNADSSDQSIASARSECSLITKSESAASLAAGSKDGKATIYLENGLQRATEPGTKRPAVDAKFVRDAYHLLAIVFSGKSVQQWWQHAWWLFLFLLLATASNEVAVYFVGLLPSRFYAELTIRNAGALPGLFASSAGIILWASVVNIF